MRTTIISVILLLAHQLLLAQFTATMKNVVSGNERIYQVYNDGENYRYEFTEDGQLGVVIVKPWKNQTIIMIPEKKYWFETTCDDIKSRMNDPVQAAYWFKQAGKEEIEGEEKIGNYMCERKALYQGDNKVFLVWHSPDLNFPVRIENLYDKNTHMDLVDINADWLSHKSYFYVPPDYTKVDEKMRPIIPEPPAPETWESRSVALPFDGILKRGEKISVEIPTTGHYKIKVINEGDTPTKYIYHLYENGEKLPWDIVGNDDRRTHRLYMDENRTFTYAWEKDWQLIVEVYEGEVMMEVYLEESTIN
jgi:hypothetical protein